MIQARRTRGFRYPLRALAAVVLCASACEPGTPEGATRSDSAGVSIVISPDIDRPYAVVDPAPEGRVWVERYPFDPRGEGRWDVYDATREYVGYVDLPGDFVPTHVERGSVLGIG